jgi:orotate phosphoribosyltransferase
MRLARAAGRQVHVLHATTAEEMALYALHRDIATVEVTVNHLTMTAPDCYERLGAYAQMNPPVRDATHRAALWQAVAGGLIDAIGGLEVGAIPMAAAALTALHRNGKSAEGFFVRKQAKGHGSKERLEGLVKSGDRVVVIDDVLTTGGSVLQAIEVIEAIGAKVVRVVCICDRLQGAADALKSYDYRPLFTVRDFGIEPAPETT